MKEFIKYLITQIVSKPEMVEIEEKNENGYFLYLVKVSQEDMGIVIGKEGKTIKAIRSLTRAKAIKDNIRMNIELFEEPKVEE